MRPSLRKVLLVAIVAGSLAACGAASGGRRAATTPARTAAAAKPRECLPNASTVHRFGTRAPGPYFFTNAQVSPSDCADVVRFEFASGSADTPPDYTIEYQDGPFTDYNQRYEIKVSGAAYLVVRFAKTSNVGFNGKQSFTSRESITPSGMHHLQEARIVLAPEGETEFVIGLDSKRAFAVDGAPTPPHVTIMIA